MAAAFNLTAQINLRGPTNTRSIASSIRKQLSNIKVQIDLDMKGSSAKSIAAVNKGLQSISTNASKANSNINQLNASIQQLATSLGGLGTSGPQTLAATGKAASSAGKSVSTASSQMQEFGKQSGLAIRRFAAFSTVTGVIYGLTNAINSAFKEFITFDKELVRLSQVTGSSMSALSDITKEITRLSTGLGVTSSDLLQVSVTLAQAGLSAQDTKTALEALAKSALAPSFDDLNSTVEGSIALMRQFGISSAELEGALGSINAVAAAFAVEASDIITSIQRTGGVFAAASNGVSQGTDALNEFIAIFTSVRATTRESAETIATGLRTIFTRIQRGSTIEALKEYGVVLTDLEGKFVGPYEAIRRLSEGLNGLDPRDLRFSKVVEELGGFRQIGKVIPLIQQFATAENALSVAQKGQSSLSKNAVEAQKSLAIQFEKTRQAFVALIRDVGNSSTFRTIATISLTTANAFISLASALKPLLPMLTALAAIKGASILSEFTSGFVGGLGKGAPDDGGGSGGGGGGGSGGGGSGGKGGKSGKGKGPASSKVVIANTHATAANTSQLSIVNTTLVGMITSLNNLTQVINNAFPSGGGTGSGPTTASKGGKILGFKRGGSVPGTGSGDKVSALLEPREYVMSRDAVEKYGTGTFDAMNSGGAVQRFGKGSSGGKGVKASKPNSQSLVDLPPDKDTHFTHLDARVEAKDFPKEFQNYLKKNKKTSVVNALYSSMGLDLPQNWNLDWNQSPNSAGSSSKLLSDYISKPSNEIFKTLLGNRKSSSSAEKYGFEGREKSIAAGFLSEAQDNIRSNLASLIKSNSKKFYDTDKDDVSTTMPDLLERSIGKALPESKSSVLMEALKTKIAYVGKNSKGKDNRDRTNRGMRKVLNSNKKSNGGFIQKFADAGEVDVDESLLKPYGQVGILAKKSLKSDAGLSIEEAVRDVLVKQLAGLGNEAGIAELTTIPANLRRRLRKDMISKGQIDLLGASDVINNALSSKGVQDAEYAAKVEKMKKVGVVGLVDSQGKLDYSKDFDNWDIGNGRTVYAHVRGFKSQYFDAVTKMQQQTASAKSQFAENLQYADIFTGEPLAFDFDETLVAGADILNEKGKPDIPKYSDRTIVQEALKKGRLTKLGAKVKSLVDSDPDFIKQTRILTARPQNTVDLLAQTLQSFGLPYKTNDITGVSQGLGTDIASAKAANLSKAEKLIDDNVDNVSVAGKSGKKAYLYKEPGLAPEYQELMGQGNIEGAVVEAALAELGASLPPIAELEQNRAVDFENGLGPAAKYFGIPSNIPTEVKRTLTGYAFDRARKEFGRYYDENPSKWFEGGQVQAFADGSTEGVKPDRSTKNKRRGAYGARGFKPLSPSDHAAFAAQAYRDADSDNSVEWSDHYGMKIPKVLADYYDKLNKWTFESGGAGIAIGKKLVKLPDDIDPEALEALKPDLIKQYDGWYTEVEEVLPFGRPTETQNPALAAKQARASAALMAESRNTAYTQAEDAIGSFKKTGQLSFDPSIDSHIRSSFPSYISELEDELKSATDPDEKISIQRKLSKAQKAWPDYQALAKGTSVPNQGRVTALSETLYTLLDQYGSGDVAVSELDNILKAMGQKLPVKKAHGGILQKFADGGTPSKKYSWRESKGVMDSFNSKRTWYDVFEHNPEGGAKVVHSGSFDEVLKFLQDNRSKDTEQKSSEDPMKKLAGGGRIKLYHGSNTGVDDATLKSFKEKGALSDVAQGYGQGAGFYVYSGKEKAKEQAQMRVKGGLGSFAVVSGDTAGKPMVLTFEEALDPATWDLDYELNKSSVVKWLAQNFDKIKDKVAPGEKLTGIKDVVSPDSSKGIMSHGIRVQSDTGSRKTIYSGIDSDLREGELVGQIMNRLQSNDPEMVHSFENQFFKSPSLASGEWDNLALKYVGSSPLKPVDIETFAAGGSVQQFARGGVPALVSNGEAYIPPSTAKSIGYGTLNRMNQADKNGMGRFAVGGGVGVFKGPGSGTSDSIRTNLPVGSFILREKATKALGFNRGGSVGVRKFATGGGVGADRMDYLNRIAEKLGVTVQQYERSIREKIYKSAKGSMESKTSAQSDVGDVLIKNLENIGDASVEQATRESLTELISKIDPNIDATKLGSTIDDVISGMKNGLSVDELKQASSDLKDILEKDISIVSELADAHKKYESELGFLTGKMKVRGIDVRAQKSLKEGKFGALESGNLRQAQRNLESPTGQRMDKFGEALKTQNIPGMKLLSSAFPKVADRLTTLGDKIGGVTGIIGSGSALLSTQMPGLLKSIDAFAGTVSETSPAVAGLQGALREAGSFGLSGAIVGKQAFGTKGAAVGGAVGLAGGAVSGFIKESTAKEVELAMKGVSAASSDLEKTLGQLAGAKTFGERAELQDRAAKNYEALNAALEKSTSTIKENKIWTSLASGLEGFLSGLTMVIGFMAAAQMGGPTLGPGKGGKKGGGGKGGKKAAGGPIGFANGGLVPVKLADGEGVFTPPLPGNAGEMKKMNNADRNGYKPSFSGSMSIVPGGGSGKVDNFETMLPEGSYVIRADAMKAMQEQGIATANKGGSIGAHKSQISTTGSVPKLSSGGRIQHLASGGQIQRLASGGGTKGYAAGGLVTFLLQALKTVGPYIAAPIITGIAQYVRELWDPSLQQAQGQAELAALEQLRRIADNTEAFATGNKSYADRTMRTSEVIEKASLTPEERRAAYGRKESGGKLNSLNILQEQEMRSSLGAEGMVVNDQQSVQEYLDTLAVGSEKRKKADAAIVKAQERLRKRIYEEARMRQGADYDTARKEYEGAIGPDGKVRNAESAGKVNNLVDQELGRENRSRVLADRLEIINRDVKKFTLNISDVMTRLSSSMARIVNEIDASATRAMNISGEFFGQGARANESDGQNVRVLENIAAYSREELSSVIDNVSAGLGDNEQTKQIGSFVKGLQAIEQELPLILRDTAGGNLEAGSRSNIQSRLSDMFGGLDLSTDIRKKLEDSVLEWIDSGTSMNRQGMSVDDLANNIEAFRELKDSGEKARKTLEDYARKQLEVNRKLGAMSDSLAAQFDKLADNSIKVKDINLQAALQLKEKFGQTLSLREMTSPFETSVGGLTGGLTDPATIGQEISKAIAEKRALESDPAKATSALGSGDIAKLTSKINKYTKALDLLANNTDRASAALKKIDEQSQISAGRRRSVMDFFDIIDNPEAMLGFAKETQSYSRVMGGAGSIGDIKGAKSTLQSLEGTKTPEEYQRLQQQFFDNVTRILANAGGDPAVFNQFKDMFAADFGRTQDNPQIKPYIDAFNQAATVQTQAVRTQSDLIRQGGELLSKSLSASADDFTSKMQTAITNIVNELNSVATRLGIGGPAVPAVPKAKGGLINYYAMGSMVDFAPKGTDTVPAMLTPGEFVVNRAATARNLPLLQNINSGKYSNGGSVKYLSKGGLLDRSVRSRFPMVPDTEWDKLAGTSDHIPLNNFPQSDLLKYVDFRSTSKDNVLNKSELDSYNSAVQQHHENYLSGSAQQKYKVLSDNSLLIDNLQKEKKQSSGFLGFGGDKNKTKQISQALNKAIAFRDKELKAGPGLDWYKTYEAAHAIQNDKRITGGRNQLEENYFGGDRNFPFTPEFMKVDNAFRNAKLGLEPADFESLMYGLASKAIPGVLGAVGGGLGAIAGGSIGTLGGLITGPGAIVTGTAGALSLGFTGGMLGDQIGQDINSYIWDKYIPESMKNRVMEKMKASPESYSGGQWIGFGAELMGGAAADDMIRKGMTSAFGKATSVSAKMLQNGSITSNAIKLAPNSIPIANADEITNRSLALFKGGAEQAVQKSKRVVGGSGKPAVPELPAPKSEAPTGGRATATVSPRNLKAIQELLQNSGLKYNNVDNLLDDLVRNPSGKGVFEVLGKPPQTGPGILKLQRLLHPDTAATYLPDIQPDILNTANKKFQRFFEIANNKDVLNRYSSLVDDGYSPNDIVDAFSGNNPPYFTRSRLGPKPGTPKSRAKAPEATTGTSAPKSESPKPSPSQPKSDVPPRGKAPEGSTSTGPKPTDMSVPPKPTDMPAPSKPSRGKAPDGSTGTKPKPTPPKAPSGAPWSDTVKAKLAQLWEQSKNTVGSAKNLWDKLPPWVRKGISWGSTGLGLYSGGKAIWDWATGNSSATIPDVAASGTPTGGPLPPSTFGDDPLGPIKYAVEEAKRKYESTQAGKMDAFKTQDGQYSFGQVVSAAASLGLKDPMGITDFRARYAKIPKFELGDGSDAGQLLTPKERQDKQDELDSLNSQIGDIAQYDVDNDPNIKVLLGRRNELRKQLERDYRGQFSLGVPTGDQPPKFTLSSPRVPRSKEDFGLTNDMIDPASGKPLPEVINSAKNSPIMRDLTNLTSHQATINRKDDTDTGTPVSGQTNGSLLSKYKTDFEDLEKESAGANLLNGQGLLNRFNKMKKSYVKDFGPVDGIDDQDIAFGMDAQGKAKAQGEVIRKHLGSKLANKSFVESPFKGGQSSGSTPQEKEKARKAIDEMKAKYSVSTDDELIKHLEEKSINEQKIINADKAWTRFDNDKKTYHSELEKYWMIRARWENREALRTDPTLMMTGSPELTPETVTTLNAEIQNLDSQIQAAAPGQQDVDDLVRRRQEKLDQLHQGQANGIKFEKVPPMEYLLFNTPHDSSHLNPFNQFENNGYAYGKPGKNINDAKTPFVNDTNAIITELLTAYGKAYDIKKPIPTDNNSFNEWIKGINPEAATSLPSIATKKSWTLDKLKNHYVLGDTAADTDGNFAAKFGLWGVDSTENAFNNNFTEQYKEKFLQKARDYLLSKSQKTANEQYRLPENTDNYLKAIDAFASYTGGMDKGIYGKVNPAFGTLNIDKKIEGADDQEKLKKLRSKIGRAYVKFKRENIDKAFGGITPTNIDRWKSVDNRYNFPGSPEEVRDTVLADVNTLDRINALDAYILNNKPTPANIRSFTAGANLLMANNGPMGDAAVGSFSDVNGNTVKGDTKLVDFLVGALNFSTPSLAMDRQARLDTVIGMDLASKVKNPNPKYEQAEIALDQNLQNIKDSYLLWDSLKSYSIDPENKRSTIDYLNSDTLALDTVTKGESDSVNIAGKSIQTGSSFFRSYADAFKEDAAPYNQLKQTISYLGSFAGAELQSADQMTTMPSPFDNDAFIMTQKEKQLQSTTTKPIGAAEAVTTPAATTPASSPTSTGPTSSGPALTGDIKTQIRTMRESVMNKANSIFADNALQGSEANEYSPMLDSLGSLLFSNISSFRGDSEPEGKSWWAYKKHYGDMKRFGDILDSSEVASVPNMESINTERSLRGALNEMIQQPKYLSSGGPALVNYQPKGTDTVPAMLTPGEFVINKSSASKHLPLLQAINSGGISYASSGGVINPVYKAKAGGVGNMMSMAQGVGKAMGFDMGGASAVFDSFIKSFNTETNHFGSLINNLAKVFPALNGPVSAFGGHVDKLVKALNELKSIEIKGPNIPDTINVNSETIRVELVGPENTNYKLSADDQKKISDSVALQLKTLITMGRIA